jgi:hypothetical protein
MTEATKWRGGIGEGSNTSTTIGESGPPTPTPATEIGPALDWPEEAKEFAARQATRVNTAPMEPAYLEDAIRWVNSIDVAANEPAALLDAIVERVLTHLNDETLLQTLR